MHTWHVSRYKLCYCTWFGQLGIFHYIDVIMTTMASQITSLTVVYSIVYSGADQRKHQSSASLAFVWGPVNSPHKGPVTRKMFPFDDVIMRSSVVVGMGNVPYIVNCSGIEPANRFLFQRIHNWKMQIAIILMYKRPALLPMFGSIVACFHDMK